MNQAVKDIVAGFVAGKKANGEKLAIVANGGGAKGREEWGFLLALEEVGLVGAADLLVGTSAGGLDLILAGCSLRHRGDLSEGTEVWDSIRKNADLFKPDLPGNWWGWAWSLVTKLTAKGYADPVGLRDKVEGVTNVQTADDLEAAIGKKVVTVATHYETGQSRQLTGSTPLYDMAMATCAIPGFFPAHNIAGEYFGDGAVLDNDPVDVAVQLGATKVLVLFCDPEQLLPEAFDPNVKNDLVRALQILYNGHEDKMWKYVNLLTEKNRAAGGPQVEYLMLWPSAPTGDLLDFSKVELVDQGLADARAALTEDRVREFLAP